MKKLSRAILVAALLPVLAIVLYVTQHKWELALWAFNATLWAATAWVTARTLETYRANSNPDPTPDPNPTPATGNPR